MTARLIDTYNKYKTIEFKRSKCSHFYVRQLINNAPITKWQRLRKNDLKFIINNYTKL